MGQGQRYLDYLETCRDLGAARLTEQVLSWFAQTPYAVGLDPSVARCAKTLELPREPEDTRPGYEQNLRNIGVVLADLKRLARPWPTTSPPARLLGRGRLSHPFAITSDFDEGGRQRIDQYRIHGLWRNRPVMINCG